VDGRNFLLFDQALETNRKRSSIGNISGQKQAAISAAHKIGSRCSNGSAA